MKEAPDEATKAMRLAAGLEARGRLPPRAPAGGNRAQRRKASWGYQASEQGDEAGEARVGMRSRGTWCRRVRSRAGSRADGRAARRRSRAGTSARPGGGNVIGQVHDLVVFDGRGCAIAGVSGTGLFEPSAFGVRPVPWVAAVWRGYRVTYAVQSERLLLQRLVIGVDADDSAGAAPKMLFGRELKRSGRGPVVLEDLAEPVDFTGGMLVGHDSIQGLRIGVDYHPAWRWRIVHELLFESGVLKAACDRSWQAAEARARLSLRQDEPTSRRGADLDAWIRQCFNRDYGSTA